MATHDGPNTILDCYSYNDLAEHTLLLTNYEWCTMLKALVDLFGNKALL